MFVGKLAIILVVFGSAFLAARGFEAKTIKVPEDDLQSVLKAINRRFKLVNGRYDSIKAINVTGSPREAFGFPLKSLSRRLEFIAIAHRVVDVPITGHGKGLVVLPDYFHVVIRYFKDKMTRIKWLDVLEKIERPGSNGFS